MAEKKSQRDDFYSFYSENEDHHFPKQKRTRTPLIVFLFFTILLSVSAWFGYDFFSRKPLSTSDPIDLTITAPSEAQPGQIIEYVVRYKNKSNTAFPSAELFVEYPKQFTVMMTDPETTNERKNFWNLGALAPGASADIHIQGIYQADARDVQTLSLSFQYEQSIYRSSFVVKRTVDVKIVELLSNRLRLEGPSSLRIGEQFTYTINYADFADLGDLEGVSLQVQIPQGLIVSDQKPAPNESGSWTATLLESSLDPLTHVGTVTLKGVTSKPEPGRQRIIARLIKKKSDSETVVLFEKNTPVEILGGDLALGLMVNKQKTPHSVQLGAKVPVTISFENTGSLTYRDLVITITGKGALASLSQAETQDGKKNTDSITWDKEAVKVLERLEPKAKGEISFSLPIIDSEDLKQMQFAPADLSFVFSVSAHSGKQESPDGVVTETVSDITGPTVTVPVLSDARIDAFTKKIPIDEAVSQSGDGMRVYMSLENTLHEINAIRVQAVLPPGIEWIGINSRSAGDITYLAATRTVAWTLNKLPSSVHRIDASFDVKVVTPPTNNAIVRDIILSAQDSVVSDAISQTIPLLTAP
ncbi:MAG: hypothetical protein Q8P56_05735 [Candidatus Uhrbacteria bacterium]|nr:hypothetical protein [Candidatus Uhrbacteria bacterium]